MRCTPAGALVRTVSATRARSTSVVTHVLRARRAVAARGASHRFEGDLYGEEVAVSFVDFLEVSASSTGSSSCPNNSRSISTTPERCCDACRVDPTHQQKEAWIDVHRFGRRGRHHRSVRLSVRAPRDDRGVDRARRRGDGGVDRRERVLLTVVEWGDDWWSADAVPETMDRRTSGVLRPAIRSTSNVHLPPTAATAAMSSRVMSTARVRCNRSRNSTMAPGDSPSRCRPSLRTMSSKREHRRRRHQPHRRSGHPLHLLHRDHPAHVRRDGDGPRNVGDTVNLEADVLAKYVERLVRPTP